MWIWAMIFLYVSLRTAAAILRTRSGSAIASISTILPSVTVNPITAKGRPPTVTTTPAAPFTRAGRSRRARERDQRACPATAAAPRTTTGGAGAPGAEVGSQHDVGVEQRDEGVEVAPARCQEEGVDHVSLTGEIGVGSRYLGAFDAAPGPAGELPRRRRGSTDHRRDLLEGQLEHVVEHEREPLRRGQGVEHDEQGEPDRVGQQRLLLRLELPSGLMTGSGRCTPKDSSRRVLRDRSMFRQTRATIVVNHPPRFSTSLAPARLRRSQASWTASSASVSEPSIR